MMQPDSGSAPGSLHTGLESGKFRLKNMIEQCTFARSLSSKDGKGQIGRGVCF